MPALLVLLLLVPAASFAEGETASTDTGILSGITSWLLSYWNQFIDVINAFIQKLWDLIVWFVKSLVLTLLDMLKDLIFWIFDTFMGLAVYAISGLGELLQVFDISGIVQGLPEEVLNMLGLLGMAQCLAMVGAAITVRLLLQLIPFVRLGS